jgi:glycosyltransferase involved in cell wall biosynthesis/uncharacterized HAD superfamily protein
VELHHSSDRADGVTIRSACFAADPNYENDDGPRYARFLKTAERRYVPTVPVGCLVTCRLEKYRQVTETWLAESGVTFSRLRMLDLPDLASRQARGDHARFKASAYFNENAALFIESSVAQAAEIHRMTRRPVLCADEMVMFGGGTNARTRKAQHKATSDAMDPTVIVSAHHARRWADRTIVTLASQSRTAWRAIFIDDASQDGTADVVESVARELGIADRVTLIRHEERRHKTRNVVDAVREHVGDDEIVVMLDGDDWLASDRALEILAREYEAGWDVVWGNWVGSDGTRGTSWHLNPFLPVRRQPWVTSHLFSFRARLLKDVPDETFKDDEGNWFRAACDQAIALPVLERAVRRKHVEEVLYVYNRANPNSHDKQGRLVNPLVSDAQAAASAILYSRAAISPPWDHEFFARHRFEFVHAAMASASRFGGDSARRHVQERLASLTERHLGT